MSERKNNAADSAISEIGRQGLEVQKSQQKIIQVWREIVRSDPDPGIRALALIATIAAFLLLLIVIILCMDCIFSLAFVWVSHEHRTPHFDVYAFSSIGSVLVLVIVSVPFSLRLNTRANAEVLDEGFNRIYNRKHKG